MQWVLLGVWSGLIACLSRRRTSLLRLLMAAGFVTAMGTQIMLLWLDGRLAWEHALPLHLCSLFGVISIPLLWRPVQPLFEAVCFLGAPGAFLTLFFPAVASSAHTFWMQLAFFQLHVLLALMPLYWYATGKPLPEDPRRTLVMGSGYLVFVCLINRLFGTNYLFLRAAPIGTPLHWMFRRGPVFYLCALVMAAMLIFSTLAPVYAQSRK